MVLGRVGVNCLASVHAWSRLRVCCGIRSFLFEGSSGWFAHVFDVLISDVLRSEDRDDVADFVFALHCFHIYIFHTSF